jgi:hypothetical protein
VSDFPAFTEETVAAPRLGRVGPGLAGAILIVFVAAALFIFVVVILFVTMLAFKPGAREGFAVAHVSCTMGPTAETVLVELTTSTTQDWTNSFMIQPLVTKDLSTEAIATLPEGQSLDFLDETENAALQGLLDARERWGEVTTNPSNIVIEFRRASPKVTDVHLPYLRLWWTSGEPAFVQDIPVDLNLTANSCSVAEDLG